MEWSSQLLTRQQHRKPTERTISVHKLEDHRLPEDFQFYKGQNLRKENSYHQNQGTYVFFRTDNSDNSLITNLRLLTHVSFSSSDSTHFQMDSAKDLRVSKSLNGADQKIKEEGLPPPQRRFV